MVAATSTFISPLDAVGTRFSGRTAAECLQRGKLDFTVEKVPMRHPLHPEKEVPGYFNIVRTDTGAVLSCVGDRYTPIQNDAFFSTIADTIVQETEARISRCYSADGSRVYMILDWPNRNEVRVLGDIVRCRAILQNSHNLSVSALFLLQPMRLVCKNGMVVPDKSFSFSFKIRHTESADVRISEAVDITRRAGRAFDNFGAAATEMARTRVTPAHARQLINEIMLSYKDGQPTTASKNKAQNILRLFGGRQIGGNHEAVRGTAWGLYNAFAEYADHHAGTKVTKGNTKYGQRFKAAVEGSGRRLKLDAYEAIIADDDLGLKDRIARILRN